MSKSTFVVHRRHKARYLIAAALAGGALIAAPNLVQAADHTPNGDHTATYTVGPEDDPNVVPEDDFSVDTSSGNAVEISGNGEIIYDAQDEYNTLTTSDGHGLSITNNGDISGGNIGSITVNSEADITGSSSGIVIQNDGTGDIDVTTEGDVTGESGNGIYAENSNETTGDITITSNGDVEGSQQAISAQNNGTGSISITATGEATSSDFTGILAQNYDEDANNITVNAADVTGGSYGIFAENNGIGDTSVTATGTVIGEGGHGIYAGNINSNGDGNVTVDAVNVQGSTRGIFAENSGAGNVVVTATGEVTGEDGEGVYARRTNADEDGDIIIDVADVTGSTHGVNAQNAGAGDIEITTGGVVIGEDGNGINAENNNTGGDGHIIINATGEVTGSNGGIYGRNQSNGNVEIYADEATVTGEDSVGILADTNGSGDTIIVAGDIDAGGRGIQVHAEDSTGNVTVDATAGTVTSSNSEGIWVNANGETSITTADVNANGRGLDIQNQSNSDTIIDTTAGAVESSDALGIIVFANGATTITTGDVTGNGGQGVYADNTGGTGNLIINTTAGTVTGGDGSGIYAETNGDATITAANVTGSTNGIQVYNQGTGKIEIDTTAGIVEGQDGDGILAHLNDVNSTEDISINTGEVTGTDNGIHAQNAGIGGIEITTNGAIIGEDGDGIYAENTNTDAGDITITANDDVEGPITAVNSGVGAVTVVSEETVTGHSSNDGAVYVMVDNSSNTGGVSIEANHAQGSGNGVYTENNGTGNTEISINGIVEGDDAGVSIIDSNDHNVTLTVNSDGVVQNASENSSDQAIQITHDSGQEAEIQNDGTVLGTVDLGNEDDTFINTGVWNSTGGVSTFGDGDDLLDNQGTIVAAQSGSTSNTIINDINHVIDSGDIILQNDIVGDTITFTNGGTGIYETAGANSLLVDVDIAAGLADEMHVDNVVTGSAGSNGVEANIVNGLGQATTGDGIKIIDVSGTSDDDAFVLSDGPFTGGLYSYNLGQGFNDTQSWFLQSEARDEAVAAGVLSILGSRTALSTLSNLHDRQRDAETLADTDDSNKGIWARAFGQSNDFDANDANGFGFNSKVWSAQAGIDFKASDKENGAREYAGLYIAYADSSGHATRHGSNVAKLDLNATTLGAYYTKYSASNWYLDLVGQYSRLGGVKARTATDELSPSGNSYALSFEVGKQFNPESNIIREVQAQLIDQYTDMKDVTLSDGTRIDLPGTNAVTGRFGVRFYGNAESGKSFLPWVRANVWHTFSGDSTIKSLGSSITTPIGGTSGEVELGFSNGNAESGGWGFYGSAGYLFDISGAEYKGWKGTLGLRKGW